jgi:proteasome lid subunit RPN8/RPN11
MDEILKLRAVHWHAMADHVGRHWPEEACGLLGGPPGVVEAVFTVENSLHSRVAYEMDPRGQVEAMTALEAKGWDVVGIFHSHPAGPPVPSATDVAQAYYPEAVYVIWAPGGADDWNARGFRIAGGSVREVRLVVSE